MRGLRGNGSRAAAHDGHQQQRTHEQAQHDQRERLQPRVDADLDEQVAAAPEEAERDEEQPVCARAPRVVHSHVTRAVWQRLRIAA